MVGKIRAKDSQFPERQKYVRKLKIRTFILLRDAKVRAYNIVDTLPLESGLKTDVFIVHFRCWNELFNSIPTENFGLELLLVSTM